MGLHAVEGDVGGGKSFVAVHDLMAGYLRDSTRPVYCNLPCDGVELEHYLAWLCKTAARQEEMRCRLRFLRPGFQTAYEDYWVDPREEGEPLAEQRSEDSSKKGVLWPGEQPWPEDDDAVDDYKQMGYELRRRELPAKHDGVREFWYFVEPNAVVFLDESADLFNSLVKGKGEDLDKRLVLQSFINHHRHYLIDLYFFMQACDDVDVQVRRKIKFVYYIENSKTKNMFGWWLLRGLRWPMQFFRVRVFAGRKVLGKGADFDVFEPVRAYNVFPTRWRFKNYRSFAAAFTGLIRGMKRVRRLGASTDMDKPWDRVKDFACNAGLPVGLLGGAVVGVWLFLRFIFSLGAMDSGRVESMTGWKNAKGTNATSAMLVAGSTNAGQVSAVAPSARSAEPVGATNSPVA